jgi:hypothetical protein
VGSWCGRGADFVNHHIERLQENLASGKESIVADDKPIPRRMPRSKGVYLACRGYGSHVMSDDSGKVQSDPDNRHDSAFAPLFTRQPPLFPRSLN